MQPHNELVRAREDVQQPGRGKRDKSVKMQQAERVHSLPGMLHKQSVPVFIRAKRAEKSHHQTAIVWFVVCWYLNANSKRVDDDDDDDADRWLTLCTCSELPGYLHEGIWNLK